MLDTAIHLVFHFRNSRVTSDFSYCPVSYLSSSHTHSTYFFIQEMAFEHQHCSRFFFIHTCRTLIKINQIYCIASSLVSLLLFSLIQYVHHTASLMTQMPCALTSFFTDVIQAQLSKFSLCHFLWTTILTKLPL